MLLPTGRQVRDNSKYIRKKAVIRLATVDVAAHISDVGKLTFSETFGHIVWVEADLHS